MHQLLVAVVVLALLWAMANHGNDDEADAAAGRWKALRGNHPDTWLVPPAIGRKGWTKR
jgi:hypothetical protein